MATPVPTYPRGPITPEHLYAISQLAAETRDWRAALETIIKDIRPYFIFDNVVVYLMDPKTRALEVGFARATGRGKSAEADVSWGEAVANEIVQDNRVVYKLPEDMAEENRLRRPFTYGLPLTSGGKTLGAIIFIRFGSPEYLEGDQKMAHFIAQQTSLMVERHQLRSSLDQLNSVYQLFQLQEDFIHTLSHEIRNPLGFIKGYTTTLLRPNTRWDPETQQEFLTIIDKETDRLQDLIENLLDSARLQSGHMKMDFQPIRVESLVNDVVTRSQMHHPDLKIVTKFKQPLPIIHGDSRRLAQVFENLVSNAVKYAPGSPVYFWVSGTENGVLIEIEDKGPGIPAEHLNQLFQRFYRVPGNSIHVHGSGLGLFIVKQIIDAHQGQITVSSEVDQGTTFHIQLPSHPDEPAEVGERKTRNEH